MIVILSSTAKSLRERLFKRTAAATPPRLDRPQRLLQHTVLKLTDCARLCSRSTSCVDLQYSNTTGLCITGHSEDVSEGQISQSGPFDLYKRLFKDPETCFEIKHNNPTAESGEYYIYPSAPQFKGLSVKVFCLMNDTHQLEYVTLPNRNFGNYPKRSNRDCQNEVPILTGLGVDKDGVTEYQKIRIHPSVMPCFTFFFFVTTDTTFASGNKTPPLQYGEAEDCYSYTSGCKKIGTFHINTLGTGMQFKNDLTWTVKLDGFKPLVQSISRQQNGAIIDVVCGGWCGGCRPKDDMVLYPS
ncbi:A disintegrin and metalloproteinase with thrombospondin motifs 9-like [Haliotis asinina]|uniref:A disintegrin and metalloproteinase with thrombospondin motifs 9-like n=1 Tax=Haliotis asinina TaxID=109174 RepID=UPI003531CEBA